jgi:hypothetical protein
MRPGEPPLFGGSGQAGGLSGLLLHAKDRICIGACPRTIEGPIRRIRRGVPHNARVRRRCGGPPVTGVLSGKACGEGASPRE